MSIYKHTITILILSCDIHVVLDTIRWYLISCVLTVLSCTILLLLLLLGCYVYLENTLLKVYVDYVFDKFIGRTTFELSDHLTISQFLSFKPHFVHNL